VVQAAARASRLVVDTSLVELERVVAGVDGNADGLSVDGSDEGSLRSSGNSLVAGDGGTNVGSAVVALSVLGGVWVRGLSVNTTVGSNVFEGAGHQTTIATLVSVRSGAVHQVLLRDGGESSLLDLADTLNGTSGGERPAATALTLVLDGCNGTRCSPVNSISYWDGGLLLNSNSVDTSHVNVGSEVDLLVLLVGEISHVGQAEDSLRVLVVPLLNVVHVPFEGVVSVEKLMGSIHSVVLVHPLSEGVLVLLLRERGSG